MRSSDAKGLYPSHLRLLPEAALAAHEHVQQAWDGARVLEILSVVAETPSNPLDGSHHHRVQERVGVHFPRPSATAMCSVQSAVAATAAFLPHLLDEVASRGQQARVSCKGGLVIDISLLSGCCEQSMQSASSKNNTASQHLMSQGLIIKHTSTGLTLTTAQPWQGSEKLHEAHQSGQTAAGTPRH